MHEPAAPAPVTLPTMDDLDALTAELDAIDRVLGELDAETTAEPAQPSAEFTADPETAPSLDADPSA